MRTDRTEKKRRTEGRSSFFWIREQSTSAPFLWKVHVVHAWSAALEMADAIRPLSCSQSTQLRCKSPALCTWTLIHVDRFQVSEDVTGSERQNDVVLRRRPRSHRPRLMYSAAAAIRLVTKTRRKRRLPTCENTKRPAPWGWSYSDTDTLHCPKVAMHGLVLRYTVLYRMGQKFPIQIKLKWLITDKNNNNRSINL